MTVHTGSAALYQALKQTLNSGVPVALVSTYQTDGSVSKRLVAAPEEATSGTTSAAPVDAPIPAIPDAPVTGDADASSSTPDTPPPDTPPLNTPANTSTWVSLKALQTAQGTTVNGPVVSHRAAEDADGGSLTLVEYYHTRPRFIILGAGHIAAALAPLAKAVDFEVIVYDDRASFANSQRFPSADEVICDGFSQLFERLELRASDYVVIVTRGHTHDISCLRGILGGIEPAYTGMIGSRRRVAIVKEQLQAEGSDPARIERIHAPIGLRIGAVTPAEIAISILAEVIEVKRVQRGDAQSSSCDPAIVEELALRGDIWDAMITVVATEGSVPIEAGAKLAMSYAGSVTGTIGGGCSEGEAMQVARDLINKNKGIRRQAGSGRQTGSQGQAGSGEQTDPQGQTRWREHTIDLTDSAEEEGMVCGGTMHLLIELL
jgi:xanthine dehydrogenase accessory factor